MKYRPFYKGAVKALSQSVRKRTYDEAAKMSLEFSDRYLQDEDGRTIRLIADLITDWINFDLIKRAVHNIMESNDYQALTDTLLASVVAFNITEFLHDPEPPRCMPEQLFRAFCLSYALGYKKGEQLLLQRFLDSGFFGKGTYYWSPDSLHPDYLAFVFNFISSYQQGELTVARPASRYDSFFAGRCGTENTINQLCQIHLQLAKGDKVTDDLYCPFGNLADSLLPYEIMAYRKLYEQCYGEQLLVEGDAVCLMEPWLEPRFENRLEDKACVAMVSALSQKLGKDFLAEALD